ncbi:MAG: ubiquitin-activating E1 FCCH domain-containing protein, partial [Planctomycetota bacterium]
YFAHPDYPPFKLSRTSGADNLDATWTMTPLNFQDGPYLDANDTVTTFAPAATTGPGINLVANLGTFTFAPSDIGRRVSIDNASAAGWATIVRFTNTTTVVVDITNDFVDTVARTTWNLGAWSATTGYPATVTFFEDRLWWGATATEPNTVYASSLGVFNVYRPRSLTDITSIVREDAFTGQINDEQLNPIRWLFADQRGMLILTDGGIHLLTNDAAGNPLGPNLTTGDTLTFGFRLRRQNNDTCSFLVPPRRAGKLLLMLEKGERRLLQESFTFQDDRVIGTDLTILADHVNVGGITESAIQIRPETRLWLVRSDGQLISMTLDFEQQVVAWARHIVGGSGAGTAAQVESVASIREANEDQIWVVTKRVINGQTKRYIEFMEEPFDVNTDKELAFFVDSGLSRGLAGNTETKVITGASQTNPVVITSAAHGFSNADVVRIRDVLGMTEINDRNFTIGNVQTNTFTLLDEDGTAHSAYVSGGTAITEVTTITQLDHLEGETVKIMANGGAHADKIVTSGVVTLDLQASIVHVGLPIASKLTTMPVTATTGDQDSRSGLMQISKIFLLVDRSMGGKIGTADDEYNEIIYREVEDLMGEALPLFTGFLDSEVI